MTSSDVFDFNAGGMRLILNESIKKQEAINNVDCTLIITLKCPLFALGSVTWKYYIRKTF